MSHQPDISPTSTADENIFCPICNYNLTGILGGRCPECGAFFERQALMVAQRADQVILVPWDNPAEMAFSERFWKTLNVCLFRADRFACAFTVQSQRTRAFSFFVLVVGISCLIALVIFGMHALVMTTPAAAAASPFRAPRDVVLSMLMATVISVVLVISLCTVLSGLTLGLLCKHYDGHRHFKPWMSITAFAAAHFLMIPFTIPVFILFGTFFYPDVSPAYFVSLIFALLACSLLTLFTLRAVVQQRGPRNAMRSWTLVLLGIIYSVGPVAIAIVSTSLAIAICE